jgi:hypothetical protein
MQLLQRRLAATGPAARQEGIVVTKGSVDRTSETASLVVRDAQPSQRLESLTRKEARKDTSVVEIGEQFALWSSKYYSPCKKNTNSLMTLNLGERTRRVELPKFKVIMEIRTFPRTGSGSKKKKHEFPDDPEFR